MLRRYNRAVKLRYGGRMTGRVFNIRAGLRVAISLFGKLPPDQFGPRALKACRDVMVARGWKRKTVNDRVQCIVAGFQWGVAEEWVAASTRQALSAVKPLRIGESTASEGGKVKPVPLAHVEAVKGHVANPMADLIDLQLFAGARGGEFCIMRPCDLDTTGELWDYRPAPPPGPEAQPSRDRPRIDQARRATTSISNCLPLPATN